MQAQYTCQKIQQKFLTPARYMVKLWELLIKVGKDFPSPCTSIGFLRNMGSSIAPMSTGMNFNPVIWRELSRLTHAWPPTCCARGSIISNKKAFSPCTGKKISTGQTGFFVFTDKKIRKGFGNKKLLSIFAVPNSGLLQFSYYYQILKLLRLLTAIMKGGKVLTAKYS